MKRPYLCQNSGATGPVKHCGFMSSSREIGEPNHTVPAQQVAASGLPVTRTKHIDEMPTTRDLHRSKSVRPKGTGERIQLEQPEMVGILGLQ